MTFLNSVWLQNHQNVRIGETLISSFLHTTTYHVPITTDQKHQSIIPDVENSQKKDNHVGATIKQSAKSDYEATVLWE